MPAIEVRSEVFKVLASGARPVLRADPVDLDLGERGGVGALRRLAAALLEHRIDTPRAAAAGWALLLRRCVGVLVDPLGRAAEPQLVDRHLPVGGRLVARHLEQLGDRLQPLADRLVVITVAACKSFLERAQLDGHLASNSAP